MAAALTPADIEALERKLQAHPRDAGTQRKLLASLRARKMRRPDLVVFCADQLVGGKKVHKVLGASEVWDVREQFFLACLDLHMMDHAQHQFDLLTAKFPGSVRVQGLKGMMLEAYAGQSEMPKKVRGTPPPHHVPLLCAPPCPINRSGNSPPRSQIPHQPLFFPFPSPPSPQTRLSQHQPRFRSRLFPSLCPPPPHNHP